MFTVFKKKVIKNISCQLIDCIHSSLPQKPVKTATAAFPVLMLAVLLLILPAFGWNVKVRNFEVVLILRMQNCFVTL